MAGASPIKGYFRTYTNREDSRSWCLLPKNDQTAAPIADDKMARLLNPLDKLAHKSGGSLN